MSIEGNRIEMRNIDSIDRGKLRIMNRMDNPSEFLTTPRYAIDHTRPHLATIDHSQVSLNKTIHQLFQGITY